MQSKPYCESDLSAIERDFGWKLPAAYRRFLLVPPDDAKGSAVRDLDFAVSRLGANREYADYLLRASKADYELSRSDVVFLFHQDYQFLFFRCGQNDDPPVYRFVEGEPSPREIATSFSDWLARLRS